MDKLVVGQSLFMDKGEFAEIVARNAHVGSVLSLIGSKVTGSLQMDGIQVAGSLFMGEKGEFAEVDLDTARIGKALDLNNSKIARAHVLTPVPHGYRMPSSACK